MIKNFLFIFFIFTITSCSYLSKKMESMAENKNAPAKVILAAPKIDYCPTESKLQYISEDEAMLKFYKTLHPSLFENKNIPFIQKAVMLALVEMSRRPDEASPYSRLQVYFKLNGKSYYYDFRPKKLEDDTKMPYLKGLDYLTQKFIPGQSLMSIATNLDNIVPRGVNVSSEFESFLRDNRQGLLKNEFLTNYFLKGDEILTRYETFDRITYKNIIAQYMLPQYSKNSDYEFDINGLNANKANAEGVKANCNYDLNKESSLKDELLTSEPRTSHTIGLADGENFFLAVSSGILLRPFVTNAKLSYFMKARPAPLPLPICEFKGKAQDIVLFSSKGRNPVQHLQHLIAYDIDQADSSFALNELLNFSRHLFLTNPDRILYESKRGRKAQLDFFLAMNFPIYHVQNLGNVFGHASFKNSKKQADILHIDDRGQDRLWCK